MTRTNPANPQPAPNDQPSDAEVARAELEMHQPDAGSGEGSWDAGRFHPDVEPEAASPGPEAAEPAQKFDFLTGKSVGEESGADVAQPPEER